MVALLLLTPAVATAWPAAWDYWLPADEASAAIPDHTDWQLFLDKVVVRDEATDMYLLRYGSVDAAEKALLNKYLQSLQATDPRGLNRNQQMAYWINLYNALTVRVVLDHPGEKSIRDMGAGWFSRGPWGEKLITVAGTELSLDDIEHRILRPIWQDRRIHFAVNCASMGCPDLVPDAYTAATLEAMLAAAEAAYIAHPRALSFQDDTLLLSSIFDWYADDFATDREQLLNYLAQHAGERDAGRLPGYSGRIRYRYDWSLNSSD